MQTEQVQYIRDRLTDWESIPEEMRLVIDRDDRGIHPALSWSTDDVAKAGRHLQVLVDTCEASLTRPEGDPDRAWAVTILSGLLLIWADRPDYPKART